jgi:hypothetical protein
MRGGRGGGGGNRGNRGGAEARGLTVREQAVDFTGAVLCKARSFTLAIRPAFSARFAGAAANVRGKGRGVWRRLLREGAGRGLHWCRAPKGAHAHAQAHSRRLGLQLQQHAPIELGVESCDCFSMRE